jgi:hypothetical protein
MGDGWLESAADLLAEDDPGPAPFLVDGLVGLGSIAAVVGRWKVGKTWAVLNLAQSIASGEPFMGRFEVARGPVMLILEESGRAALHRRLGKLARGRGIAPEKLSQLYYAANRGVNLSDPQWRSELITEASRLMPHLVVFDPLARVKGGNVDESSQSEIGPVLDFMRELREASGAAVLFVHHAGHEAKNRMRGSSDLEAYWESKVTIAEGRRGTYEMRADHREAPSTEPIEYRLNFDGDSLRLEPTEAADELRDAIVAYLTEHPGATVTELREAIPRRAADTSSRLADLEAAGTAYRSPSQRRDKAGRTRTVEGVYLACHDGSQPVPDTGHAGSPNGSRPVPVPAFPAFRAGTGTTDPRAEVRTT